MAEVVIKQIEEGMTGRQVADLLYSNFLALLGAIGSGGGGDIPVADIEKGVTAYGWGDHRQAGYLKGITAGMVTGALGYTPMDEAAWTKANIKATLGIADWALAASKPAYTTKEVAEDGNLYFTDARAVAALAGVTNALAGDIGVLQGYFTNGVAKSAAKLATSRKLWGQLFNGEADVTGALTGVTDITASGTLTIGKIKIGDGVIEWDAANGGFKITGGLWATDYLSSKGVNTGASGGGGGGSSYQRLDTWDGYTSAKDGWVLSAKLGYGLKTTQDDILRQLADISGQGTNVTFTPALTSGTQIGTLTIDGEPVKMYAPSIPSDDINKGVTAYGWGNHASAGYAMASALGGYLPLSGNTTATAISGDVYFGYQKSVAFLASNGALAGGLGMNDNYQPVWWGGVLYDIIHSGNFTEYTYSKSTIDTKLGAYLPLSGGTLSGQLSISANNTDVLVLNSLIGNSTATGGTYIKINYNGTKVAEIGHGWGLGTYMMANGNTIRITDNGIGYVNNDTIIHSGNIGSQSVNYATNSRYIEVQRISDYKDIGNSNVGFNWHDWNNLSGDGLSSYNYGIRVSSGDANIFSYVGFYYGSSSPYIRTIGYGSDSGWKQLAFIDDNVASATKLQTARKLWGQSFDGTADVTGAAMGLGGAIDFQFSDEINRYGGTLYLQHRGDGSQTGTVSGATGNVVMCYRGGNVGIGINDVQYKLDVNGTLHASGMVIFDSALNVASSCRLMGNVGIGVNADDNKLCVYGVIRSAAYNAKGNNNAAFVFDKPGSNYTGIGANGVADTIYFGACSITGAWATDYYQKWHFNGEVYAKTGIWSDGYVSAKGQNTTSDMRLKRVLEEVTLSVEDIAAAPAFRFAWKGGAGVDVGTSAQYWEKLVPDAVKRDDAGWRMMQYGNVAMVALISLARRVKELEEQLKIKN